MGMQVQSLELEPDSYLAFTTGQVLLNGTYSWLLTYWLKDVAVLGTEWVLVRCRVRAGGFEPIHRGRVITIQEIEHFEEHLCLDALSEIESLGETHIHVDESGRGLRIPRVQRSLTVEVEARAVEQTVSIEVGPAAEGAYAVVETALGAENPGELHLPRELPNAVCEERVIQCQVRGTLVNNGSVIKRARLGHWIQIAVDKGTIGIRLARD
jgi:hypothetical protein